MKSLKTAALACLLLVTPILCGTGWSGDAPVASTPKGAMKALLDAMHRADAPAVQALSINADPQLIDLMCALATATARSRDAAVARFGDAAKDAFPDNWAQAAKGIDDAVAKEDGDTATLISDPKAPDAAVHFKKVDTAWKVDFASIPGMSNAASMRSVFRKLADANNEVADEIKSGMYATAQDASQAVSVKMMAATQAAAPTTQR